MRFSALFVVLHTVHRRTGVFGCVFCFVFFVTALRHRSGDNNPDSGSERGTVFLRFDPLSAFFRVFRIVVNHVSSFSKTTHTKTESVTAEIAVPIIIFTIRPFSDAAVVCVSSFIRLRIEDASEIYLS